MSIEFWADPVDVLVYVNRDPAGQWRWAVSATLTTWPDQAKTHTGAAASRADALLDAMVYLDAQFSGSPVNLYCDQEDFISAVRSVSRWTHMEAHDPSKGKTHGLRRDAAQALECDFAAASPLVIAVDGSFSISRRTGGWAWMDEHGGHGQGSGPAASSAHAELMAISLALQAATNRPVTIRCDSQEAIDLASHGARPTTSTRLRPVIARIRTSKAFGRATFEWISGHAGDPLNEAANRLAIAARRDADAGTSAEVSAGVAAQIVAEHLRAHLAGQSVPATARLRARS